MRINQRYQESEKSNQLLATRIAQRSRWSPALL